jgi:hypothetical protein
MAEKGLVLVVLRTKRDEDILPDAFGCYIGPSVPIEVDQGTSWRDALADETARANALEDAIGHLGYEIHYYDNVAQLPDEVQTLAVNDEPWEIRE